MSEQVRFFEEKPGKVWAMTPAERFATFEAIAEDSVRISNVLRAGLEKEPLQPEDLNADNLLHYLRCSVFGLASTRELAEARMVEAVTTPRVTQNLLYQQSFVEPEYLRKGLAVVAFVAAENGGSTEQWTVEGFLGDVVVPETRTLDMMYAPVFGVDVADQERLNQMTDEWYPAEP